MHEVLVNRLGGLSLPRKSVVRLTDRPDMTLDVCRGRKIRMQQQQQNLMAMVLAGRGGDGWMKYGSSYGHFKILDPVKIIFTKHKSACIKYCRSETMDVTHHL